MYTPRRPRLWAKCHVASIYLYNAANEYVWVLYKSILATVIIVNLYNNLGTLHRQSKSRVPDQQNVSDMMVVSNSVIATSIYCMTSR